MIRRPHRLALSLDDWLGFVAWSSSHVDVATRDDAEIRRAAARRWADRKLLSSDESFPEGDMPTAYAAAKLSRSFASSTSFSSRTAGHAAACLAPRACLLASTAFYDSLTRSVNDCAMSQRWWCGAREPRFSAPPVRARHHPQRHGVELPYSLAATKNIQVCARAVSEFLGSSTELALSLSRVLAARLDLTTHNPLESFTYGSRPRVTTRPTSARSLVSGHVRRVHVRNLTTLCASRQPLTEMSNHGSHRRRSMLTYRATPTCGLPYSGYTRHGFGSRCCDAKT